MKREDYSSNRQRLAKAMIGDLLSNSPLPKADLMHNLGLYMRGSYLAKILFLHEVYEHILGIPGVIMEFGTWWGANVALFHNLRSVLEPYNRDRTVIGFDSFNGYPEIDDHCNITKDSYCTTEGWERDLEHILKVHQADGSLDHVQKFKLIKGDIRETLPRYLKENPHTTIALAFCDVAMYEVTKEILLGINNHLINGSVIVLDEFGSDQFRGETEAFKEVYNVQAVKIIKSKYLHTKSFIVV
jgi:hypothetical protein